MAFELWPALLAGAAAGAAIEAGRWLPAAFGRGLVCDFMHTWGSFVGIVESRLRWIGLVFHLLLSAIVGLLYAVAFDVVGAGAPLWGWGLAAAAVHLSIAGFVVARIPMTRTDRPAERLKAGLFASRLGELDTAGFVLTHFLFGLTLAVVYGLAHSGGDLEIVF